jgi:TPR repeat protein
VVEEKQQQRFQRSPGWTPRAVKSSADADAIRAVADDSGAGPHGYRYAMLLLEGRVTDRDPALAFQYAYRSALVGNLPGMELLAQMFREGIGTSVDAERAASWEHEAAVLRAPPPGPGQPARSVRPPRGVVPAARWWARRLRRAAGQRRRLGWSRR